MPLVSSSRDSSFDAEPSSALVAIPAFAPLKQIIRGERAPADLKETRDVLLELARRKSGSLPAEWLVAQVMHVTEGTDWPSRRAALEALLRRLGFAARDELSVVARPARGALAGAYTLASLARRGKSRRRSLGAPQVRPYRVEIYGISPVSASCDCADFLRSSLGACKHVLVALEDVAKRVKASKGGAGRAERGEAAEPRAGLCWDPVRSWTGLGDRLEGLRWHEPPASRPVAGKTRGARGAGWLETIRAGFDAGHPRSQALRDDERRVALITALLSAAGAEVPVEPAAIAVLREELAIAERRRDGRAALRDVLPHLRSLRRKLYPYQREGIARFIEEQRLLLADDMGLGKTTQAIAACHALLSSGRVERGLLIVPAALKAQWAREWESTTDRAPLVLVEGSAEERARLYQQTRRGFLVSSYEQLLRDLRAVQRFDPELVVLDEAQRIKNWATKSSAYVMSLAPAWRLVLTGTPMENRLEELATLLDWVDDSALAPKWRLAPWHSAWGSQGPNERVGARHLGTLRERLARCMLRRIRRDVLAQLPPRSDVRVPVEMTSQQREEHDARTMPIAQLLSVGQRRPLRQPEFLKLMQLLTQQRIVSNGLALLQFDDMWRAYSRAPVDEALLASTCSPKLGELRRVIRQLVAQQGRKVVVFSQWRKMLRLAEWAVRDLLEGEGVSAVFFTGQESQRLRTQNVVAFHDDPSVRVMFLTDAGGVGLNLQRAASACINLELPWNPAVLEQRIGRIYRLGQTDPVEVINLVTEYGIEARLAGLVGNKKAVFDGLFDGTTDTVRFEGPTSFIRDIERLVEPIDVPEPSIDVADPSIDVPELTAADEDVEMAYDDPAAEIETTGSERAEHREAIEEDRVAHGAASLSKELPPSAEHGRAEGTGAASSEIRAHNGSTVVSGPAPARDVASLFARIAVSRTEGGGLRIEAPPEAANELSQLLEGLAGLMRAASRADSRERGESV